MKNSIQTQINNINDALGWIKANKPDQYEQRFLQLVQERCRLRKIAATELENPAIAAYGESQKGKSYVITNLLSDNGKPFTIKANGREYDFVKEINPITRDVEATGVVTRFTTFDRNPELYLPDYPILIKLLGVAEVATILCDGYHSDLTDYQSYSDTELKQISAEIYDRYAARPDLKNAAVTEDDILDMKYYLLKYTGGNVQSISRSPYFDRVALIARKVPVEDWNEVFSPLWHRNATLTRLFDRLLSALSRLSFAKTVNIPVEAVLNTNMTLMSVQRINELGNAGKDDQAYFTDVIIRDRNGGQTKIEHFDKSELSALCAEAVVKVEERFLNSTLSYDMTMITAPDVQAAISDKPFRKDILNHTDLLDFPGARARNQLREENLDKTDSKSSMSNDANIYLRGKVAYLFNRYSDNGLINILLFCHDHAQRNDDTLYITLDSWIKQYVGETPSQRKRTVELAGGSPFFLIATKFNIDMTMADANPDDVGNSRTAIDQRWHDRFNVVLFKEVIHGNDSEWFKNWITEGETFKNTYLLRDYKYSGNTGKGNNLYLGFAETGRETSSAMPDVYYDRMRTSFIESPYTRNFFSNPEVSWDVAATANNDGALYLFERLAVVATNMEATRKEQTASTLKTIGNALFEILKDYYHADDAAEQLRQDINRACSIRRELVFACNANNYFFGRMIQNLQTSEKRVYNTLYDLIQSSELTGEVNDFKNFELIRKDIGKRLDRCSSANDNEQKWECVMAAYNLPDRQSAEEFLAKKGVNPTDLFAGAIRKKMNSVIMADRVFEAWIASIKSPEALRQLSDNGNFDPIEMSALTDNIELTAIKLKMPERLEQLISEYVNIMNINAINISLIADIMATEINDFVYDLGYSSRTAEEVEAAERIIDNNPARFDPLEHIHTDTKQEFTEEELTELFNHLNANPEAVTPAFEQNFYRWIEYMVISFLLKGQIINYDINANNRMGQLLKQIIK